MTIHKGSVYFILALQLVVLASLLIGAAFLVDTRSDQTLTRASLVAACERNNRIRDATHFNTEAVVERALLEGDQDVFRRGTVKLAALTLPPEMMPLQGRPWLVDCEAAYP